MAWQRSGVFICGGTPCHIHMRPQANFHTSWDTVQSLLIIQHLAAHSLHAALAVAQTPVSLNWGQSLGESQTRGRERVLSCGKHCLALERETYLLHTRPVSLTRVRLSPGPNRVLLSFKFPLEIVFSLGLGFTFVCETAAHTGDREVTPSVIWVRHVCTHVFAYACCVCMCLVFVC